MSVIWLLDKAAHDDNLPYLKDELTRQNVPYITARYIPFERRIDFDSSADLPQDYNIFAYGSLSFAKTLLKQYPLVKTFANLEQFQCAYYYSRFGRYIFNQDHCYFPFGSLIERKDWIFDTFGEDDLVFMRPNSGDKVFSGQLFEKKYWKGMLELGNIQCKSEEMVLLARPKNILEEYRVVIGPSSDMDYQRIVTLCRSHRDGKLDPAVNSAFFNHHLVDFVHEVLHNVIYEPDPFWVMDVALGKDGKYYVLEVNSMSCSGFYLCDLVEIVRSVNLYFAADNICGYKK